jgi:nucleoside-diphosphate-sugar epimerase
VVSLVTGASGFLGSRLVRGLTARGDEVRAYEGDLTDASTLRSAVAGAARVFHCAEGDGLGAEDPSRVRAVNVGGTQSVLRAAAERRILAVYVGSVVALGPTRRGELADESHGTGEPPRSPREAAQREALRIARSMARAGARLRIALPATLYGPDDPGLPGDLHRRLARGGLRICALGAVPVTLLHVDDCVEGLALAAERGTDGDEHILAGACVTVREWLTLAATLAGRPPPRLWLPDMLVRGAAAAARTASPRVSEALAMSRGRGWAFRADKARRDLGWTPRSLEDGLRETMAFYGRP